MRVFGPAAFVCLLGGIFVGCATGTAADDSSTIDSGNKTDASTKTDSGSKPDTGGVKDTGTPPPDTGTTNCGGQCLGLANTCCNNTCVDITSDDNNCGGCGSPCGGTTCCASTCVDTMGSDTQNCGGCGVTCNGTCVGGSCQTQTTCTVDLGSCSHSVCKTGTALPEDCDISADDITYYVCDPYFDAMTSCCTSNWDASCVSDAQFWLSLFGETCNGC